MRYNVWVHAREVEQHVELGTGVATGEVQVHPLFGKMVAYRYEVQDVEEFTLACERLDAVAMYEQVAA